LRRRSAGVQSDLFPGFTDVTHIGGGGFSSVYRAREIDTDRTVALKLLNVHEVSPHALDSFRRETKALGPLSSHPNIVTLYRTFVTPQGMPVLVLELCRGSVADRVRAEGPLAPSRSVSIAIKIAGALETAHRAGMLHRDVKPQNILVTEYDEPALADFGLARLQSSTEATAAIFAFTTLHAAPELLEGSTASPATDVYELASSLYQLLSGRAAFRSYDGEAPASVILRILRDPVAPLVRDGVPMTLSDLLVQAMAKDPSARPASMKWFAEALCAIESQQGWPRTAYAVLGQPPVEDPTASLSPPVPTDGAVPVPSPFAEPVAANLEGVVADTAAGQAGAYPAVRHTGPIDDLTATDAPLRFVDGSAGHAVPSSVLPDLHRGVLRRIPGIAQRALGGDRHPDSDSDPDPDPDPPGRRAGSTIAGHPCAKGHAVMVGESECRRCGQAVATRVTPDPASDPTPVRRLEWDAIESAHRAANPVVESGAGDHGGAIGERPEGGPADGEVVGSTPRSRRFGGRFPRPGSDGPMPAVGTGPPIAADAENERSGPPPDGHGSRPDDDPPRRDGGNLRPDDEETFRRGARTGQALPGVTPHFYDLARPSRVPASPDDGTPRRGAPPTGAPPTGVVPSFGRGFLEPSPSVDPPSAAPPPLGGASSADAPPRPGSASSSAPVRPSRQAPGFDILAPEGRKSEGKRTVSGVFRRRPREDPPGH